MHIGTPKSSPALGFLTAVADESSGVMGGYLVLDHLGRPLEFHCTAPVKPNRAQEILYGPTIDDFLYGEQIGQTLVSQAKTQVTTLYTDLAQIVTLRHHVSQTVALVTAEEPANASTDTGIDEVSGRSDKTFRLDGAHHGPSGMIAMRHGTTRVEILPDYEGDRLRITRSLEQIGPQFDLQEPFSRIREAIAEAQHGA